tara:strand:+ start:59 stop:220 length:162 start_codon:yes stop_codon:yes gene_type:complete
MAFKMKGSPMKRNFNIGEKIKRGLKKLDYITSPEGTTGPRDYIKSVASKIKGK